MADYRYLIVGGGMTAHAAAAGIREVDAAGTLGLVGDDPNPPYLRPPLSKGLWTGKPFETIWLPEVPGLELHTGRRAVALDVRARRVVDDHGEAYGYERLLLATGARPRRLPFGGERVVYFRTLGDYRRLRTVEGLRAAVIGGGFIGSEIAAALAQNGKEVTLLFPDAGIGARGFPADLSAAVTAAYRDRGVQVLAGERVIAVDPRGAETTVVRTASGKEVHANVVVAGIGVEPDTALAEAAGLEVENGILVDDGLRTSAPDVFAAGDAARFPSAALGMRVRVEHEDAALSMGRSAGRAMAGAGEPYRHLPFFYSDLFDLGYEAVGELDSTLETVSSWKVPFREGVVYYLRDGRVRGVLLWGIFGQVEAARRLVSRAEPARRDELRSALA
jgi:3-phenylpropionate/trans-cinnamate dioxygenase ferredoxin reductase component